MAPGGVPYVTSVFFDTRCYVEFYFWPCSYDQMIVFVNTFICINFVFGWFYFHCIVEDKIYTSFGQYFFRGEQLFP